VLGGNGDVKVTSTAEASINGGGGDHGGSTGEEKVEADATGDDKPFPFPQFENVQQSPSDHHYIDNIKQVCNLFFL
jgi:ubiquitin-conjugating enzyme E2 O